MLAVARPGLLRRAGECVEIAGLDRPDRLELVRSEVRHAEVGVGHRFSRQRAPDALAEASTVSLAAGGLDRRGW